MYDSPLEWCSQCKEWVALDQTVEDCAKQHCCRDSQCPMAGMLRTPVPAYAGMTSQPERG